MNSSVTLPPNAFMHFRHFYQFDHGSFSNYDGGLVEYSTNGGGSWSNAGPLFVTNGYNGTLSSSYQNPLGGQQAFTYISKGYYSSLLSLNSLAGSSVRFRFRQDTDNSVSDLGWLIDDVRIYTCALPATTTNLATSSNPAYKGTPVTFKATVSTSGATAPTGTVTFKDGAGNLSTVALSGGSASYTTSSLSTGGHSITAVYSGDSSNATSTSGSINQQIVLGVTTPLLVTTASPVFIGQSIILKVTVASPGVTPTGTVTFKDGVTTLAAAPTTLDASGSATYTTSSFATGIHKTL